jgi:hypothetical protein
MRVTINFSHQTKTISGNEFYAAALLDTASAQKGLPSAVQRYFL